MIDILQEAAGLAGKTLLTYFRKELDITQKTSHQNIVTQADTASQKVIVDTITALMVKEGINKDQLGFIAEENMQIQKQHLFVIDPLDGTNNFSSRHDYFSVSIAHFYNRNLKTGLIYQPSLETYYIAEKGKGAYKMKSGKKEKMHILRTHLKNSLIVSYFSSNKEALDKLLPRLLKLNEATRGVRLFGSCCLDLMHFSDQINQINIVIHAHPKIWDLAAAKLIVEEAGGIMTDWQGKPIVFDFNNPSRSYEVLICHPQNLQEIIKIIK